MCQECYKMRWSFSFAIIDLSPTADLSTPSTLIYPLVHPAGAEGQVHLAQLGIISPISHKSDDPGAHKTSSAAHKTPWTGGVFFDCTRHLHHFCHHAWSQKEGGHTTNSSHSTWPQNTLLTLNAALAGPAEVPTTAVFCWQLLSEDVTPSTQAAEKGTLNGQRWKEKRYNFSYCSHWLTAFPTQISPPWGSPCSPSFLCACCWGPQLPTLLPESSRCDIMLETLHLCPSHTEEEKSPPSEWNLSPAVPGQYVGSKMVYKKGKEMVLLLYNFSIFSRPM